MRRAKPEQTETKTMMKIKESSFEEEKFNAYRFGDEEYSRKLDFAKECLDLFGWDIEVDKKWIDGLAEQYERIVT